MTVDPTQDLSANVVSDVGKITGYRWTGSLALVCHGKGRQVDAGRPSFGLFNQLTRVVGREINAELMRQLARFRLIKDEVDDSDLEKVSLGAPARERKAMSQCRRSRSGHLAEGVR